METYIKLKKKLCNVEVKFFYLFFFWNIFFIVKILLIITITKNIFPIFLTNNCLTTIPLLLETESFLITPYGCFCDCFEELPSLELYKSNDPYNMSFLNNTNFRRFQVSIDLETANSEIIHALEGLFNKQLISLGKHIEEGTLNTREGRLLQLQISKILWACNWCCDFSQDLLNRFGSYDFFFKSSVQAQKDYFSNKSISISWLLNLNSEIHLMAREDYISSKKNFIPLDAQRNCFLQMQEESKVLLEKTKLYKKNGSWKQYVWYVWAFFI